MSAPSAAQCSRSSGPTTRSCSAWYDAPTASWPRPRRDRGGRGRAARRLSRCRKKVTQEAGLPGVRVGQQTTDERGLGHATSLPPGPCAGQGRARADQTSRLSGRASGPHAGRPGCRVGTTRAPDRSQEERDMAGEPGQGHRPHDRAAGLRRQPGHLDPGPAGDPARQVRAQGQCQERRHRGSASSPAPAFLALLAIIMLSVAFAYLIHWNGDGPRPALGVPHRVRRLPADRRAAGLARRAQGQEGRAARSGRIDQAQETAAALKRVLSADRRRAPALSRRRRRWRPPRSRSTPSAALARTCSAVRA